MKFEEKHTFDKPAATILRMYSDRSFFERKYKGSGAWDVEVLEHEKNDRKFRIKCRFNMKSDAPVPEFARKFIGESISVVQQDSWDLQAMTGRLETEIKGMPVKISADMVLRDEGSGASNQLKWTVSCGIPLIGGKLEKVVAEDLQAKSQKDLDVTLKILQGY